MVIILVTSTLILYLTITGCNGQLISPCPRLFKYEPQGNENDCWYGIVTLLSDAELSGVWLRLIFDKSSIQLGNWFGEVVTEDNREYLVKNPKHKLLAHTPYNLRFYIKYNPNETPPKLTGFRLNARTVCPEGGIVTEPPVTTGQLMTSSVLSTTPNPVAPPLPPPPINSVGGSIGGFDNIDVRMSGVSGGFRLPSGYDDDFIRGDFFFFPRLNKRPIDNSDVPCGSVIQPPKALITHGQAVHEAEFPWHAALYHAKGVDLTYFCGASLVSKIHLVTAAHCVYMITSKPPVNPESLVVYLGKYYLERWSNPGIQDRHVDTIIPHPKYNPHTISNDVAIIKLAGPADITNYVRPVCLWEGDDNLQSVISKQGTVVGWGFDENGRIKQQLTKAKMPIVSQETCIYSYPEFFSKFTSSNTFCAGFRNGTSVCNGDSGGGMVFPKQTSDPNTPIWQLRGLTSLSVALQNQSRCDTSHYIIFTDVAKYLGWIKANMN